MTCHRIVQGKKVVGWICDGRGKTRIVRAFCPYCCVRGKTFRDRKVKHLATEIHEGYCGFDMICGRCGQWWNTSDVHDFWYRRCRSMSMAEREENIRRVREAR